MTLVHRKKLYNSTSIFCHKEDKRFKSSQVVLFCFFELCHRKRFVPLRSTVLTLLGEQADTEVKESATMH